MNGGVPQQRKSSPGASLPTSRRHNLRALRRTSRVGPILLGSLASLIFASSALASTASVGLGKASPFSVLGGSTVTNTGATTMFGDLGLDPGSEVTGEPHVLGQTHVDDQVAIEAKEALTTAFTDAGEREPTRSAGTELAGQEFSPGVYDANESLLLSSGSVTLNAEGNPDAVFIFQIGSTLITGANTSVSLVGGAQACNVFWKVGSSATLGSGTRFVGTIMAADSITANTGATIHGRLLARTAAVTLEHNTITNSTCASSETGTGGGTETSTGEETTALEKAGVEEPTTPEKGKGGEPAAPGAPVSSPVVGVAAPLPIASRSTAKHHKRHRAHKAAKRRSAKRHSPAHPTLRHRRGAFTG